MRGYARSALVMAACTVLGTVLLDWLSITDIAMLYLIGVGIVASRATRREAVVTALLSVALFDFFFVPPRFTFAVSDLHYIVTFGVMFVTALVISWLAERVRAEATAAETRQRGTAVLSPISGELLSAQTLEDVVAVIGQAMRTAFGADARVLLRRAGSLTPTVEGAEGDVAQWALSAWEPAGIGAKHFPEAAGLYLPLVGSHGRVGVLELRPDDRTRFSEPVVLWLLQVFAAQAALALERSLAAKLGTP